MITKATNNLDNVTRRAWFNKVPAPAGWIETARAGPGAHTVYEIGIYRLLLNSCFIWIEDFSRPLSMDAARDFVGEILRNQDFRALPLSEPLNRDILRKFGLTQVGKIKGLLFNPPAVFLSTAENASQFM
jgi:hypothetical protein